ncbi:branched-chain amino acid ABC transporter permease [Dethiobacter alkaliphilus]|uniref:Inner-membrane translocator n=1 Tax=Dethiobacter alkaliphilus AHT 1 TaxID=555088 RepID=C0GDC4_DETAL|nr:branched-chain amino acid ABC transporter permease [Dethiobacter alkaliphilus]EEG78645.1 inner-membrane translocator [Dethiobacter alkaliphilus AHT 1]
MWEQIFVNGIIAGGKYAMLALGFSLIYGVARIMNLTHTAYYMLSAYLIFYLHQTLAVPLILSYILSIIIVVIIGMAAYKVMVAPVRERFTAVLIITLVLAMVVQEAVLIVFGGHYRTLTKLVSGTTSFSGMTLTNQHLFTLGAVIFVLGSIWILLFRTSLGIAIRAMAMDREVANLMGMPESQIAGITVAISVGLAAVAGAVVAPLYILEPAMWMHPLVVVMAAVILGGLGSIKGSIIGAFILAFAEVGLVFLVPQLAFLRGAVSMAVLLAVLMIRPEGLFGIFMEGER